MLIKELMPMAAPDTVARTAEEAIRAVQAHGDRTLLGLVEGPRFAGVRILRSALFELGWAMESAEVARDGVSRLHKATITGCKEKTDGWKYSAFLLERDGLVRVILALVHKFGQGHDPALAKAYKELLQEED